MSSIELLMAVVGVLVVGLIFVVAWPNAKTPDPQEDGGEVNEMDVEDWTHLDRWTRHDSSGQR